MRRSISANFCFSGITFIPPITSPLHAEPLARSKNATKQSTVVARQIEGEDGKEDDRNDAGTQIMIVLWEAAVAVFGAFVALLTAFVSVLPYMPFELTLQRRHGASKSYNGSRNVGACISSGDDGASGFALIGC